MMLLSADQPHAERACVCECVRARVSSPSGALVLHCICTLFFSFSFFFITDMQNMPKSLEPALPIPQHIKTSRLILMVSREDRVHS